MSSLSNITPDTPLVLVGCGKMGGALLTGWLASGLSQDAVWIVDPYATGVLAMVPSLGGDRIVDNVPALPSSIKPSFVVLAVKPQMMDQALAGFQDFDYSNSAFMSIAAGKTIGYFGNHLGQDTAIVRAMPNTPAAIGRGITVGCPNKNVTTAQKNVCDDLLKAAGDVEWVSDESLIDAVTAVSGSGPAYVFHLVEALAGAAEQIGLDPDLAKKLARATVCGAGALLDQSEDEAGQLRMNVTSPNGTTEAALNVLMGQNGLGKVIMEAVRAAHQRSRELAE